MIREAIGRREFVGGAGCLLMLALAGCQGTSDTGQSAVGQEPEEPEEPELTPADFVDVAIKDALDDYSWEELSEISRFMSEVDADSGEYGFGVDEVAAFFNLCGEDGSLKDAGTKTVTVVTEDGPTEGKVRIIGFVHDDRADGAGKAGITFQFATSLGTCAMSRGRDGNEGGWEQCVAREHLRGDRLEWLPDDLLEAIVPVTKMTNNVGEGDPHNIGMVPATATEDSLWLLSAVEVLGGFEADNSYTRTLRDEGSQYEYYDELGLNKEYMGADMGSGKLVLGEEDWWLRSPMPTGDNMFCTVAGEQWLEHDAAPGSVECINTNTDQFLLPAFCV